MPPRRLKRGAVERLMKNQVAKVIAGYERNKTNPENARGAGGAGESRPENTRGVNAPKVLGCSYKTFLNCKPRSFSGTEGIVKFAACTQEGRALMWWNGNVHTLGLSNAKRIPWSDLKRDDIEGYNNCFHELASMCPDLVTPERKKIERYVRGLLERVKENITSFKPASLHEAINMARELVEQAIQAKATRIRKATKENRKITNRTITTATSIPIINSKIEGNKLLKLMWCGKCQRVGHHEKDCRARAPARGGNSLRNVTCYGCGEKGHYKNKCPNRRDQPNECARGRA
ncbi:putative reverse transcriptase domain-containing protein [Tanacetum coccineum]|uniref:Reverse transcriptase domain-containing protein n=1 Tax=Tanacetum coccineum TaxID=301880 RepID=A0ABQ5FF37_9ASTR